MKKNIMSIPETYLLSVYERVRHQNTKLTWKAPFIGIQININKNVFFCVCVFKQHAQTYAKHSLWINRENKITKIVDFK